MLAPNRFQRPVATIERDGDRLAGERGGYHRQGHDRGDDTSTRFGPTSRRRHGESDQQRYRNEHREQELFAVAEQQRAPGRTGPQASGARCSAVDRVEGSRRGTMPSNAAPCRSGQEDVLEAALLDTEIGGQHVESRAPGGHCRQNLRIDPAPSMRYSPGRPRWRSGFGSAATRRDKSSFAAR